ncbi:MAG: hypothetical protein COT17_01185 [Elusimicrobia bacterium CG08_land_8_20_14_0_20_51_18]|nr:MAG: hypothetical protein COT17_01185 [Elusimicrobia bacterium CG08_land_8_20_14_0_20_51_18]
MKNKLKFFIAILFVTFFAGGAFSREDQVLKAMKDELGRTVSKLKLENLSKPYFVSYYVGDSSGYYAGASFGDLVSENSSVYRSGKAEVRIGEKKFDSSNFISNFRDYRPLNRSLPISDDYDSVRKSLWLMSDEAYKIALERYSQKDAYRKKKDIKEIYGDVTEEAPVEYLESSGKFGKIEPEKYREWIKKLSSIFKKYPNIQDSDVFLNYSLITKRFVNSENTSYRTFSSELSVSVFLSMQNDEGFRINDSKIFLHNNPAGLDLDRMEKEVDEYARSMNEAYNSEKVDYYVGPALFEGQAAGEFFNQLFVRNISFNPKPWADKDEWLKYYYEIPKLNERIGKRIFPAFISAYDDPSETSFGEDLIGNYKVDSEGVKPGRLELVKKGKLEHIYASRVPDKSIRKSNGHGRGTVNSFVTASAGNVFINSEKALPYKELLGKITAMGKEQELEYVVVVKKIASYKDSEKLIGDPVLAYKLNLKTMKRTPINISEFDGMGLRALRDIAATGDEKMVYNFYQSDPYSYTGGQYSTSIICPSSILIQEIELKKTDKKTDKKPYLPNPYFSMRD